MCYHAKLLTCNDVVSKIMSAYLGYCYAGNHQKTKIRNHYEIGEVFGEIFTFIFHPFIAFLKLCNLLSPLWKVNIIFTDKWTPLTFSLHSSHSHLLSQFLLYVTLFVSSISLLNLYRFSFYLLLRVTFFFWYTLKIYNYS